MDDMIAPLVGSLGARRALGGSGRRDAGSLLRRRRSLALGAGASGLALARGVLDDGVHLAADDEDEAGEVEPGKEHDHAADRSVGDVVISEARRVFAEA